MIEYDIHSVTKYRYVHVEGFPIVGGNRYRSTANVDVVVNMLTIFFLIGYNAKTLFFLGRLKS